MQDINKLTTIYSKILDNSLTLKLINFGTIALFLDYWISLIQLSWLSITANLYNPLLWKMEANGEHHVIDIIFLLGMYMILAWRFHKLNIKVWGLFALYFWYVCISFHETAWWTSYLISHTYFATQWIYHSSLWLPDGVTIASFFIFYKIIQNKNKQNKPLNITWNLPYKFLLFLCIIFSIWIALGFPVTVDYYGWTIYYFNTPINGFEILVWASTITIFLLSLKVVKPELVVQSDLNKPKGVNVITQKGQSNLTTNTYNPTDGHYRTEQ